MSADRIHLSVVEAREHSERALRGIGYDAEEARIIADHAIDAALCGYEYSGLAKILNIPEHRRFKRPRSAMKVLRETEISTLYDGGNNVGMLAMFHAARAAIAKGGDFEASMAQDFKGIGRTVADTVKRYLAGEKIKQSVIYVPTRLITSATVKE